LTNLMVKRLRRHDDAGRRWPGYLFGGHMRTSTFVLIVAFAAVWFVYNDHQQSLKSTPKTTQVPATQIVPPGFVPDPNYTWVPRTRVQQPEPTVTVTQTPTTTPPPPTTTTTAPPPFQLPTIVLPPPFGPPVTTTAPPPGQAPTPPPAPAPPPLPQLPGLP
jgi:hypothetical protein